MPMWTGFIRAPTFPKAFKSALSKRARMPMLTIAGQWTIVVIQASVSWTSLKKRWKPNRVQWRQPALRDLSDLSDLPPCSNKSATPFVVYSKTWSFILVPDQFNFELITTVNDAAQCRVTTVWLEYEVVWPCGAIKDSGNSNPIWHLQCPRIRQKLS